MTVFYKANLRQVVWKWCLLFVALGALNFAAVLTKTYCLSRAGERLTARLRRLLFRALVRQDIGFFDAPGNESGALCARLATDTTQIQNVWAGAPSLALWAPPDPPPPPLPCVEQAAAGHRTQYSRRGGGGGLTRKQLHKEHRPQRPTEHTHCPDAAREGQNGRLSRAP